MRRDGRLRRTTIEELTAYLDSAREFTEAVFEETGRRPNMFRGYANCRRALRVIQEGTDSSMETRTRLVPLKYGIDAPCVNYKIGVKRLNRAVYLDLAYPEYKICIEFDGGHHAGGRQSKTRSGGISKSPSLTSVMNGVRKLWPDGSRIRSRRSLEFPCPSLRGRPSNRCAMPER